MLDQNDDSLKILLVDDDAAVLSMLKELFRKEYSVLLASSGEQALQYLTGDGDIAVVVMDIKMPGMDGIAAARQIRAINPDISVVFHTGYPGEYDEEEIDEKEKPFDYIEKGEPIVKLMRAVRNGYEGYLLKRGGGAIVQTAEQLYGMVGRSAVMQQVYRLISKVAACDKKVVILGETGSGKELVAQAIHYNSGRREARFVPFSCNYKSPDIIESELFGHTRGAFTGAVETTLGLFEYADGGTVFLDEIGDLDLVTQGKLLRVLETGQFQTVGSPIPKKTNIRLICATHRNLESLIATNHFREDLYYRLRGVMINLPHLRERKEDIPLLVERFRDRLVMNDDLNYKIFDPSAIAAFMEFDWPGNVRQLLDTVESLMVLTDSDIIMGADVRSYMTRSRTPEEDSKLTRRGLARRMREFKRQCVIEALAETNNNISEAARLLGLDRSNFRRILRTFGLHAG